MTDRLRAEHKIPANAEKLLNDYCGLLYSPEHGPGSETLTRLYETQVTNTPGIKPLLDAAYEVKLDAMGILSLRRYTA